MPCCRGREQHCRAGDDLGTETMAELCSSFPTGIKYSFKHLVLFWFVLFFFYGIPNIEGYLQEQILKEFFMRSLMFLLGEFETKNYKTWYCYCGVKIPGGHPTDSSLTSQAKSTATFQGILGNKTTVCYLFQPSSLASVRGDELRQTGTPGKLPKGMAFLRRIFQISLLVIWVTFSILLRFSDLIANCTQAACI